MDFFYQADWLNREPPYAFQWDHLLMIFLLMFIGVGLCFLLQKKEQRTIKIVLISFWGVYLLLWVLYVIAVYGRVISNPKEYPFDIETMLPLHSCLMFAYVFPFAIFVKNKVIKTAASNFLVVVNMIMGFITLFVGCPAAGYSAFSFFGMQTLLYHGIDVIVPLVMVATKIYDIKVKDIYYGLALFGILGLSVWIFDAITGCDYFYFYDGHTFPVFKFISENVHHLVWTLLIVSCYVITAVATHFLVIGVKYLIEEKILTKKEKKMQASS